MFKNFLKPDFDLQNIKSVIRPLNPLKKWKHNTKE